MTFWLAAAFLGLIGGLVALDLGVLSRRPRRITPFEAAGSVALWMLAAAAFGLLLAVAYHRRWLELGTHEGAAQNASDAWLQFITAYVTELGLSLDNIAVLALVFAHFGVTEEMRRRVLFWAIIACLILRAGLVGVWSWCLHFDATRWVLGALLVFAMFRTLVLRDEGPNFEEKWVVRLIRKVPSVPELAGQGLWSRQDGRVRATPLLTVVVTASAADLSAALDSVPAAFAVTRDPLIALTANTLAILALRSLYFVLADVLGRLRYVKVGLVLVLLGLAAKAMLGRYELSWTVGTLAGTTAVMGAAIGASTLLTRRRWKEMGPRPTPLEDMAEAVVVTRKNLRKVVILIVGTSVLLLALALAPLPGPGFVLLGPLGLAILATEFIWARRLLLRLKEQSAALQKRANTIASRTPLWLVLLAGAGFGIAVWLLADRGPWNPLLVWTGSIAGWIALGYVGWRSLLAARLRRNGAIPADAVTSKVDPKE